MHESRSDVVVRYLTMEDMKEKRDIYIYVICRPFGYRSSLVNTGTSTEKVAGTRKKKVFCGWSFDGPSKSLTFPKHLG
jgi:hypothetical protein